MPDDRNEGGIAPGPAPVDAAPPPGPQAGNQPQLYKLIFDQNLDEVHLLIDFVSGRADRSLTTLAIPAGDASSPALSSREVIKAIAEMRFPPKGSEAANADNAAILLLAKDRLSALATPARGLTIAYTAMFIDAEVKTWAARAWDWMVGIRREADEPREPAYAADTRVDLAVRAFPVLQRHARRFRRWRDCLAMFSVVWLLVTAFTYWDAGLGRASLDRLDQNWKAYVDDLRDDPTLLVRCSGDRPAAPQQSASAGAGQAEATSAADAQAQNTTEEVARAELGCRRHEYRRWVAEAAGAEVRDVFHCEKAPWFSKVIHVWCWQWLLPGNRAGEPRAGGQAGAVQRPGAPPRPAQDIQDNATYWQTATAIQSVFTTYVLPMMFALLGTIIGAFRAILNKVRDSLLAPRDFVRMMLGLPTGLVAGVAVGLFLSPSSVPMQGSGAVAGELTLTASGLGFLAGYASHSFFAYLDTVVTTVFPGRQGDRPVQTPVPPPARP